MHRLHGVYDSNVDTKCRLVLPASFMKKMPAHFDRRLVLMNGQDQCIMCFFTDVWEEILDRANNMSDLDPAARIFKRAIHHAIDIDLDSADRIKIPQSCAEFAGIKSEIIISCEGQSFAIWDKDVYQQHLRESVEEMRGFAKDVYEKWGESQV